MQQTKSAEKIDAPKPAKPGFLFRDKRLRNLHSYDTLTCIFVAVLGVLILFFHEGVKRWPLYVIGNFVFIGLLIWFINFVESKSSKILRFIRNTYPIVFYTFVFKEINEIMNVLFPFWLESHLIQWDLALFGTYPTVWLQQFHGPFLNELMAFAYGSYYLLFPLTAITLCFQKSKKLFRSFIFSLSFTLYTSYFAFLFLSARGPRETLKGIQTPPEITGIFGRMVDMVQANVAISGAAFPSAHVTAAWIILIYLYKYRPWLGWLNFPITVGLTFSTVYLGYHYAVDAISGFLIFFLVYPLGRFLEKKFDPQSVHLNSVSN